MPDGAFQPLPRVPDHVALELEVLETWERERTFEQLGSVGHRAAAWIAKADLDTSRGSAEAAAAHYRRAAEALQDFHF